MIKVVHFANEQELRRLPWLAKQLLAVQAACPPTIMAHNLMAADLTVCCCGGGQIACAE
jgi:hypothetical protein